MKSQSIFAVPAGTHDALRAHPTLRKRKRGDDYSRPKSTQNAPKSTSSSLENTYTVEYTAVVTPAERLQRRLAGLPLDQEPPSPPFPHAPLSSKYLRDGQDEVNRKDEQTNQQQPLVKPSLHSQHLAAMSAILHRCMMVKDYQRAGRALGLILRNEVGGRAIDIRSEGLWGIGAEILLRRIDGIHQDGDVESHDRGRISRDGLERAKIYYERLMVQYPFHKTWPDVINALDFCTALFGLWVYVANYESLQMQQSASLKSEHNLYPEEANHTLLEAKAWEFGQAQQIAESMDKRMRDRSFADDPELIRLRAMVAFWIADLLDLCSELETEEESVRSSHGYSDYDVRSGQVERMVVDPQSKQQPKPGAIQAADARKLAHDLLAKIRRRDYDKALHKPND